MEVNGKIAIVTGASSGIGLATAQLLATKGAKIALVSRSKNRLEEIAKQIPQSYVIVADMSKPKDIQTMVASVHNHFGTIDILVNNAGQGYDAPVEKINIDIFHEVFDLDVVGPLVAMQKVIPIMRSQGKGVIVNVSSGTALMYLPHMAAYSSLKRALTGLSLTAREELKNENIHISVVYPFITATNFENNTITDGIEYEITRNGSPNSPDSAAYVAEKIFEAITTQNAEIFAHEWMKKK